MNLLSTRRFLPLFVTQFLGAFNDNLFKNALVMLITYQVAVGNPQILITLAAGLFILPFLLFSATAGQLADKYDRARIARATKIWEIIIMAVAVVGFHTGSAYFLLFVLFCMGAQSTFFGPVKYALLPQHLHENELIAGNGYIEAGTFLAILIGTIAGGLLIMQEEGIRLISISVMFCAVAGYLASRRIPPAPASMPDLKINWNMVGETWRIIQHDRGNRPVFMSILGISWFWLIGATHLSQFPTFAKDVLNADETVVVAFLTVFSVGIGIGSLLCNRLLKGEIKSTFVPHAAIGITLFTVDLFFASSAPIGGETLISISGFLESPGGWRIVIDLLGIAVCGGLYIVPLYAILQHASDPAHRARTIASNNVMNALFMVAAALATVLMLTAHFSVPQVFLTVGMLNGAVAFYIRKMKRA
jgi:acyl-[acyl-carrier-protein]-phospholipid O-acyltransferase / long-chain-fatty-acid--[acyl-carrier-protein] ligase